GHARGADRPAARQQARAGRERHLGRWGRLARRPRSRGDPGRRVALARLDRGGGGVRLGPWAAAVLERLGDAELPATGLEVAEGRVSATVEGCEASFAAELVPQRVWAAMWRFTRGNGPLELAAEG